MGDLVGLVIVGLRLLETKRFCRFVVVSCLWIYRRSKFLSVAVIFVNL